ncbi:hypothetical protein HX088_02725 [Empedobacter sp. 225-1]|uniref:hypothetical protein n=1 Tax=unclassified Empedobacter TaxID=2643773 RepID=UPI002575F718|nr:MULTISPECIES: hypothetical protein [unclassified Empedobacter]MDM1522194.1 hypothetical protein [Empedobacter sp. 225-1]MDM1542423.1 hypothetical protein [Empedobacter sp. 189-2]
MKKVLLTAAFAVAGMVGVSAQTTGVEGGVHIGIPVGDAADYSSFNLGVDLAYLHPVASNVRLGIATGYDHFIADSDYKDLEGEDYGFIPLAASAKFDVAQNFFLGADLGYAFATGDKWKGGLYYQPKVGYSGANFDVYAAYKGLESKREFLGREFDAASSAVAIGFAYKF